MQQSIRQSLRHKFLYWLWKIIKTHQPSFLENQLPGSSASMIVLPIELMNPLIQLFFRLILCNGVVESSFIFLCRSLTSLKCMVNISQRLDNFHRVTLRQVQTKL